MDFSCFDRPLCLGRRDLFLERVPACVERLPISKKITGAEIDSFLRLFCVLDRVEFCAGNPMIF